MAPRARGSFLGALALGARVARASRIARAGAASSIQGKGGAWGEVVLPAVPPAGPGVDAVDVIFVSLAVAGSYEYVNGGRVRWRADSGGSWHTNSDRIRVIGFRSRGGAVAGLRTSQHAPHAKKSVDARGVRFDHGVKPVESPAEKYSSLDTLGVFFAVFKGAMTFECTMIGRFRRNLRIYGRKVV